MPEMTISQVARQAGLRPSTLRYYEEIGLLPTARRRSGQRRYDSSILQRLAVIHTARQAGFTLNEIAILVNDIIPNPSPSPQWRDLLERKLIELSTLLSHVQSMRSLLEDVMRCDDPELADCIYQTGRKHGIVGTD
ncbi:MAG TPA: MerR family transcriptional regulator [Aggregatilineales bacterium]|nr:MerR family transcriptional regulator [Aggregatilineales bacterium]